jgi:hypothetical protein
MISRYKQVILLAATPMQLPIAAKYIHKICGAPARAFNNCGTLSGRQLNPISAAVCPLSAMWLLLEAANSTFQDQ